jgi:hypothetical protein
MDAEEIFESAVDASFHMVGRTRHTWKKGPGKEM